MAIFGDFDTVLKPRVENPGWEHILFTDNKHLRSDGWRKKIVNGDKPRRKNRFYKVNYMQSIIGKYDILLYLDGNIQINCNLDEFAERNKEEFIVLKHPDRTNLNDEAKACIKLKKDNPLTIITQMAKYQNDGYKFNNGLTANGFILRRNTERVKEFCRLWWDEITTHSIRDQLSFMYVLWKYPVDLKILPWNTLKTDFLQKPHQKWRK